jgi:hypothetical protein
MGDNESDVEMMKYTVSNDDLKNLKEAGSYLPDTHKEKKL